MLVVVGVDAVERHETSAVIPDVCQRDIVCFGFAPLYTRHADAAEAVDRLARIMQDKAYADPAFQARAWVT